jgi:hypothetical protein
VEYRPSRRISLKAHPQFNEKWLQQLIIDDSSILGLGDLIVRDAERRQRGAGRLDLLLSDPENLIRYEVEIQLGATDESHIIRTIEYWDNEKRRFPQYDHVAVIVAEDITSRFLNVINLFNQAIPLIAIQMSALEVNGVLTLSATKVLDLALPAPEEEDEPGQETNREYWTTRASIDTVAMADRLLQLINEIAPGLSLKFNKYYIGLQRDGLADNFVSFAPRRKYLVTEFRIAESEELTARLEDSGLTVRGYDKQWRKYRLQLTEMDLTVHRDLLADLVRLALGQPTEAPLMLSPGDESRAPSGS